MATIGRGRAVAVAALLVVLWVPVGSASAHPLGNFTINHYSRLEVGNDAIRVRYVLDLAEIPSVQEVRAADTDGNGVVSSAEWDAYRQRKTDQIAQQLELTLDEQPLQLRASDTALSFPTGQGDIPLVRLEAWFQAPASLSPGVTHRAVFRDRSDPARIGWREIVVQAGPDIALSSSDVPTRDVSDELRNYPGDLLQNPLDRRDASWTFSLDPSSQATAAPTASSGTSRPSDAFADLISTADLNPAVVALALLGAAVLGGIHAASPGHGKSIMAAYIVGTRGTISHAIVLALSVTIAHTAGVLVLGLATVLMSNLFFPEQLYPWLTLVSGVLVLVVGLGFVITTMRAHAAGRELHSHAHEHPHPHDHSHPHQHSHPHEHPRPRELAPTWRGLFALGLAGGIVPSGSALVVLLSSVALGRLGFGLVLIVAFGLGMAVVLVATGVLLVHAGRWMARLFPDDDTSPLRRRVTAAVPLVSAGLMTMLGVVATFEGLSQLGLLRR